MEKIKKYFRNKEEIFMISISILFGIVLYFAPLMNDDVTILPNIGTNIKDCWKWSIDQYDYWSSRQIINFVWAILLLYGKKLWAIFMMLSMYVFQKALFVLFRSNNNNKSLIIFIVFYIFMFPFYTLNSAGWIATTTSYFCPQAFAILSLITIKKSILEEKISIKEFIIYCLGLIYGANAEQMCVVLLFLNFAAFIYLLIKKKKVLYVGVQLVLAICSFAYFLLCPGNSQRGMVTEAVYFPTFKMLDTIDKIDIGLSTTLKWMLVDNNLFIIIFCIMCAYFVWKKYSNEFIRLIAIVPVSFVLVFGTFSDIVKTLLPQLMNLSDEIDYYGSFTVENQGVGISKIKFAILLILTLCVLIEIILLNKRIEGMIVDICLAVVAVGSRVMMAFSGSNYASGDRTNTTLFVCFAVLATHIYVNNYDIIDSNSSNKVLCFELLVSIFCFLNFVCIVFIGG